MTRTTSKDAAPEMRPAALPDDQPHTSALDTENRELLAARILESAPAIIYVYDLQEGLSVFQNRPLGELLGYTPEQAAAFGDSEWRQLMHPDDAARFPDYRNRMRALCAGESLSFEYRMRHADGAWRWILSRDVSMQVAPTGEPRYIVGTASDITEQKQVEQAVRASEERFELLYEASRLLSETLDPETIYARLREIIARVMPMDGLVVSSYDTWDQMIRPEHIWADGKCLDTSAFPAIPLKPEGGMQSEVIRTGKPCHFGDVATRVRDPRGTYYEVQGDPPQPRPLKQTSSETKSALMVPMLLEGQVTGVVQVMSDSPAAYSEQDLENLCGIVGLLAIALQNARLYRRSLHEVTERARAEEALRESEERLRLAMDAVNGIVFDWRWDSNIVYRSNGLQKLVGYIPNEVPATPEWWTDLIHPDDKDSHRIAAIHASTATYQMEYRVRHRKGQYIYVLEQGQVLRDAEGKIHRVIGTTVDITAHKQAQKEITGLNARLQRAVAESHHRIKNNLQVLSAMIELQTLMAGEMVATSQLMRVGQHIRTLAALHDLLTLEAKVGADGDQISLKRAIEKLTPMLQVTADKRKIIVTAEEISVPAGQGGSFMLLVNELVSNAMKHGSGEVEITLRKQQAASPLHASEHHGLPLQCAVLEVCDDGPGFAEDFDPKRAANTGLELIESMACWDLRGEVVYTNRMEGGARVVVTFPLPDQ